MQRVVEMGMAYEIVAALELLTPHDVPGWRKIRVGPGADGGYVMMDDQANIGRVYSFGIGPNAGFDHALAEIGKPVHMFDHTIAAPPVQHPNFDFHRSGLGGYDDLAGPVFALDTHIRMLGHETRADMLLKIDVEGAEFAALLAMPLDTLRKFRQVILEVHDLGRLVEPVYRAQFIALFRHLNAAFTLCHVHGNNFGRLLNVAGMPVAEVVELTYLRSDLVTPGRSETIYPTELDRPNNAAVPDLRLWFFPFLPTNLRHGAFRRSLAPVPH